LKKKSPRAVCLEILNRTEEADRLPDKLLTDSFKKYRHLSSLDRAFLTELTYGVFRRRQTLDWILSRFSKVSLEKIESTILNILRMGLYQILFLTRTPVSAAVNESVEMAKPIRGKGGAGFVNGILRSVVRQKEEIVFPKMEEDPALHLSVGQSYPLWLVQRWMKEVGVEEALKLSIANNQIAPLTLRTNTLEMDREYLIRRLIEKGLKPRPTICSEEGVIFDNSPPTSELPFLREGNYVIQDEASQMVTLILDPKPGERILDACAAPGGKATHIAQRMANKGEILAVDLTQEKLRLIRELCQTLGVKIVKTGKGDASRPLLALENQTFDRILADVPCSGFGTLRRNPDLKWRKGEEDIRRLSVIQASILGNLSQYLNKGGILVYSTCTIFREENEDVVEAFLKNHVKFELDDLTRVLSETNRRFVQNGYFKTFPQGNGMDGFFVARLIKQSL
jgi:16S rRNA (cytosine967-C5)-methyltransferase